MDLTTVIGIIAGLIALIGGYLLDGGHLEGLFEVTSLLIVFGGTAAAVVISFPLKKLKTVPTALKYAFTSDQDDPDKLIAEISAMATTARREGVLALENVANQHNNAYLRSGLMMVVDGTDPELTKQILELEIDAVERMHEDQAKIFEAAGSYAPTMGIIGTVMGLVHVLSNLSDPGALGPSIAVAFTATLYGVVSANLLYLPIASKIKARCNERIRLMEMMLEGILSVQAGENPTLIQKKLQSFMFVGKPGGERVSNDAAQT
ncbi:flagellar motor protein [Paenibacillaceae bacterium]|nr:flagellar motor protein [Paenibacillaceae bacterium]